MQPTQAARLARSIDLDSVLRSKYGSPHRLAPCHLAVMHTKRPLQLLEPA